MVSVDQARCFAVASRCKTLQIRKTFYERPFLNFDADRETKLRVYLFSSAICHQTHTLHHAALNLWGWNFLEFGFLKMLREKSVLLNPGYLSMCTEVDIEKMLLVAFSPDGNPEHCTLDRIPERAGMLIEICQELKRNYQCKVSRLIDSAEGRLIHSGLGLYETLGRFSAFADPLKKKITFFVKLAIDAGVIMVRDPGNLIPIMDYHMQRVLLRMGCVEVDDEEMIRHLTNRKIMESDLGIRIACINAMQIISRESGHGILKMNDFFWPLGRSCCNETTLCTERKCSKIPCSFFQVAALDDHQYCFFEEVCMGNTNEIFRRLREPLVETNFY